MSTTYRAAYYTSPKGGEMVLTLPEHAHLTDDELTTIALQAAQDGDIIDMDETDPEAASPRMTKAAFDAGLRIGEWRDR